jgi:thiopeptide-type bacteriocin biosynthesis protein
MTSNEAQSRARWQSYHFYFGRHYEHMDTALVGPLRAMLEKINPERWFYLRYTDRKGPHIRLRVLVDDAQMDEVDRHIMRTGTVMLDELSILPPANYEPLIRFAAPPEMVEQALAAPVELNKIAYEPEFDVYGDAGKGMPIAEEFFWEASRLALDILDLNRREVRGCHKTLAPMFAERVISVFEPEQGRDKFLKFYASYWMMGSGLEHIFSEQFAIKLQQLRTSQTPVMPRPESLHAGEQAFLARWEKMLERADKRYREETKPYGQVQRQKLVFNFLHLMNNRLGFSPFEEAYIATVLGHTAAGGEFLE